MDVPSPDKVMPLITGAWAARVLGAARHGLFTALEGHPDRAAGVAEKTGISTDYRSWLNEAHFASVEIIPTPTPATIVVAR